MNIKKIVALAILSVAVGLAVTACYKTHGSSGDEDINRAQKTEGLTILEKARLARIERKAKLDRLRKEKSEFYTLREEGKYEANVFFENEIVDSVSLSVQVPSDFIAVLSKPIDGNNQALEKLTLISEKDKASVEVDNTPNFAGIDFSKENFCQSIQAKRSAYSNVSVASQYELYKDNSKYICVLHLKDVTTNNTINEIIEVFSPEGVKVIKTVSFNNTFLKDEIIKTAFERIYSPELKDSVRIALGEFYDNEDYQRIR